jgi:carbon starvation protein CstA
MINNTTPAVEFADGKDYVATNKNVLLDIILRLLLLPVHW